MSKFWNWTTNDVERTLYIEGIIAEESWFDDEVTPKQFKKELHQGKGDITILINSPGGDCIAAAQIYTMLINYDAKITIKIVGLAASAASVIAMAGHKVIMSPPAMLMIHNPSTYVWGESCDMKRAEAMLDECKESIINTYESKTGLDRGVISKMMDDETWFNANSAIEYGFADEVMERVEISNSQVNNTKMTFNKAKVTNCILDKIAGECKIGKPKQGRNVDELLNRLDLIKKHI